MTHVLRKALALPLALSALVFVAACGAPQIDPQVALPKLSEVSIDPDRTALALREVGVLHAQGRRAWCVPFARNLSGIQIRGDAHTWWGQAGGQFARGQDPRIGSVMSFTKTSRLKLGHIAVVSEIISDREIRVDHANWNRNKVSHKMAVIDVSEAGDWSAVKVESNPGAFGSVYPVTGFIYPNTGSAI